MEKRGFLGSVEVSTDGYWTEGKGSQQLRCNETVIYAEIDTCQEYVSIAKSKEDVQEQYSMMDMYYMCLRAIDFYALDENKLRMAGVVIGNMIREGEFSVDFPSLEEENENLVRLIEVMRIRVDAGEKETNLNFAEWYADNVVNLNYYHNPDGSKTKDKPRLQGVGATQSNDYWTEEVKKGAMFMLYLVTDTDGNGGDARAVARKKMQQNKHLNYIHGVGNNLTLNSMLAIAKGGIVNQTGQKPEDVLEAFKMEANRSGVRGLGDPVSAAIGIAALVGTILSAVASAVTIVIAIVNAVKSNKAAEQAAANAMLDTAAAPTPDDIDASAPGYDEWKKMADEANKNAELEEDRADDLKNDLDKKKKELELAQKQKELENGEGESESIWKNPLLWIGGLSAVALSMIGIIAYKRKKKD